ncbi:TrkH family potassium uptake protein [Parasporobacterium paucivorans]|uniref:Trk system potassium uptake protein TrkH n=1 Tax=Parasporobacterium paucivorans DSM 15970 TaxID=1122934 RepID=A0A1M6J2S6_9FIRM|nr:potassium transporter TrkG [Parasporobacterium paucivorans]SHJ41014.1 trk system potassium uptake protein TrkH [Parasporobacterium paucivorans DSM 15970]
MQLIRKHKITTTQMITGGFFLAIFIGGILLSLPIASKSGQFTPLVDSFFASTTSVCVTGLTTVVTVDHWNLFGQIVILCLIQFGGLGVVTFVTSIFLIMKRRITLSDRMLIQEAYNLETLQGLVKLTIWIMKGTFLVEAVGALLYSFQFVPEFGLVHGVWYSIFHAVSAFCNAGIDLIGSASFIPYQTNPLVNINTMLLIIIGGIGYPVWWDIIQKIKIGWKEKLSIRLFFRKLSLHTKIVLITTFSLILFGALFVFINEYGNQMTIGNMNTGQKIMASFFQSITFRTAGFLTVPQEDLKNATSLFGIVMMFIGGSPSGTAGGIKTVTFAILVIAGLSSVRKKECIEILGRRVDDGYVKKSLAIFMFSISTLVVSTICLSVVTERDFLDLLFESASALGTVGLSKNVTMSLTTAGKIIIMATMFLGRVGPITMALSLRVGKDRKSKIQLPEEKVLVG